MNQENHRPPELICPKCTAPNQTGSATCVRCGVIFGKIHSPERMTPPSAANLSASGEPPEKPAGIVRMAQSLFLALLALYTVRLLSHPIASNFAGESFLHLVNLPFHEAGHIFLSPFGRFLQVAGGTIMQLLIPAVVAGSFLLRKDRLGFTVALWWFGESMLDVAPYADDARAGQLPLLGGVTGSEVEDYHDWEVMLGKLGLLAWDHGIGRCFFVAGGLVMATALIWGLLQLWRTKRPTA